jgi:hypothetical protein
MNKLTLQVTALIITIMLLGVISWMGRYEIVGADYTSAYRLDRWTGEVAGYFGANGYRKIHWQDQTF